jgi:hypothetical protein
VACSATPVKLRRFEHQLKDVAAFYYSGPVLIFCDGTRFMFIAIFRAFGTLGRVIHGISKDVQEGTREFGSRAFKEP